MRLSEAMEMRRREREDFEIRSAKRNAQANKLREKFTPRTDLHPSVGVLISAKGVRYYAYVKGVYTEGTPEQLDQLLFQ